jgi:integrase
MEEIEAITVATYIEQLGTTVSKPTVKQHLAAIRQLFDYLTTGGVLEVNPAASVRGPKYVVRRGKTPVLSSEEVRKLLDSIESNTLIGLRDQALIGTMVYSFARVGAAITMKIGDYFQHRKRWWLRLHEKGGKRHEVPCHPSLEEYLNAWLSAAGITRDKKGPLFRSMGKADRLGDKCDSYAKLGLNDHEMDMLGNATPHRQYFFRSPIGSRLFTLELGDLGRAICASTGYKDVARARELLAESGGPDNFLNNWLVERGISGQPLIEATN